MSQSLILIDAVFPLNGGKSREGKKKKRERNHCGGGFPGAGPALLAVLQVAAVRYN
jgi:hypothetical protein